MRRQRTGIHIALACAMAACGALGACANSPRTQNQPSGGGGAPGAGSGGAVSDAGGTGTGGVGQTGGAGGAEPSDDGGATGVAGGAGGASGGTSPGASGGAGGASAAGGNGGAGPSVVLPPGPAAPVYFHAGTRLKPRLLRGGGLEVLDTTAGMSWFDTLTGDWCAFRTGADGVERCFPDTGSDGVEYFLDSACKKPAFLGSALRCDGGNFHHVSFGPNGSTACNSVTYRLGQPVTGTNTPLYSTASGRCESSGPAAQTNTVWPLEKVPVESFVAVQRVRRQVLPNVDIGLDAWVREGADGSWEVIGFYDPVRKGPCARLAWDVSSDACVPTWAEANNTFSDSTCTQRATFDDPLRCSPSGIKALLDLETTGDSCTATTTIKALWETTVRSTQLYDYDPGARSCKRSSLGVVTTYGQGAPIDVASLPKLEIIPVGTGSLRIAFYAFDKVPFYPANGGAEFIEAASGHPCTPRPFADGTWRCVPSTFPRVPDYDQFYLTPDCTGERIFPWVRSCSNTQPEPIGMVVHLFGCGRTVTETLAFDGTTSQGALFHPTPGSACTDLTFTIRDGVKLFRATKPVNPADLFVPFERKLAE